MFLKDRPIVYRGDGFTIVGYGMFAMLNALAVFVLSMLYFYTRGLEISLAIIVMFPVIGAGTWIGSKAMHIAALGAKFLDNPLKYLAETGFYVQGGILGSIASAWVAASVAGVDTIVLLDGMGWGALLGLFFGRLGCFNYGCCFGREVHSCEGGVCYHNPDVKALRVRPGLRGKSIHPSQIYTALSHLAMFSIATAVLMVTSLPNGFLTGGFLLYHGLSRLFLERFRADFYYKEGRNWTTFRSAGGIALLGAFILSFGNTVFTGAGVVIAAVRPPSLVSLASMIGDHPWIVASAVALSLLVFFGYGVHGRKLGTFPWSPENTPERAGSPRAAQLIGR